MSFEHIMLDLETLSSREDALILSIGAVRFDLDKLEVAGEARFPNQGTETKFPSFYEVVDLEDAQSYGLRIDASTVSWWVSQDVSAQDILKPGNGQRPLKHVLSDLTYYINSVPDSSIWGNGSTFDNMILRNAYRSCGISYPVSYRNDLCYRTIRRLFPHQKIEQGIKHNALDDARNQALTLVQIMKGLKKCA